MWTPCRRSVDVRGDAGDDRRHGVVEVEVAAGKDFQLEAALGVLGPLADLVHRRLGVVVADQGDDGRGELGAGGVAVGLRGLVVAADGRQHHLDDLVVLEQLGLGAAEGLDLGQQAVVGEQVVALVARGAGGAPAGGEEAVDDGAALLQPQGQLVADGGAHAVPEDGQRLVGPRLDHVGEEVGEVDDALHARLGAPVLPAGVLHGQHFDAGVQRARDREVVAGGPARVRQAQQPRGRLRRRVETAQPGVAVSGHRLSLRPVVARP